MTSVARKEYASRTYTEHLICECGAEMEWNGDMLFVFPPKYSHVCPKCKKTSAQPSVYPHDVETREYITTENPS